MIEIPDYRMEQRVIEEVMVWESACEKHEVGYATGKNTKITRPSSRIRTK